MATKDGVAEALCQIGISPNVPDSNLEPANLVDALARIGDAIHHGLKYLGNADASTPMGALEAHGKAIIDAGESIAGSVTAVADAIDRHADAVNELARALHMDPLSHAICTGIRHGLFGAEAQSDETIHAGLYDVAQALREGQVQ